MVEIVLSEHQVACLKAAVARGSAEYAALEAGDYFAGSEITPEPVAVTFGLRRGTSGVQAAAASIASTSRRVQSFTSETNALDRDTGPRVPRPKRVLIVDDQPHVLDVLREIVGSFRHRHAYEITTARSAADALVILQRERFDLILMDMVMPEIGDPLLTRQGIDLLKRVRDLGVNAPVLIMSGDWESRKEADALIEGAFGYLHKPFDLRELDHLVARAIGCAPHR